MHRPSLALGSAVAALLIVAASGRAQQAETRAPAEKPAAKKGHGPAEQHSPREMNRRFEDPDLDVQQFVQRFENAERDIFAKREAIVKAVDVRPGQAVADIGAGTGLFTRLFAGEVGPTGKVYAVEIAPAFLKHIAEDAKRRGLQEVIRPVRGGSDSPNLEPGSIDLAFVCATYHHFEHPAAMLGAIHRALRPGGRIVIIDFDLRPDSSEFVREHARAPLSTYVGELNAAGFERIDRPDAPELRENFYAEFRRIDQPAAKAEPTRP